MFILNFLKTHKHAIRQWMVLAIVLFVAAFLVFWFVVRNPLSVKLPESITNLNIESINNLSGIKDKATSKQLDVVKKAIVQKLEESNDRLNYLESAVRQQNTEVVEKKVPEALGETNIRTSVGRMVSAWGK